jgi:hypothetical protein
MGHGFASMRGFATCFASMFVSASCVSRFPSLLACLSDLGCPLVRAQANEAKRSAVRVCLMKQALLLDQFQ